MKILEAKDLVKFYGKGESLVSGESHQLFCGSRRVCCDCWNKRFWKNYHIELDRGTGYTR